MKKGKRKERLLWDARGFSFGHLRSSSLASRCWQLFLSQGSKWRASLSCHYLTWLMNPGWFFWMFSFLLFFFYSWRYSFGRCFFLMSFFFFLFPGSYLTSSFSLLSPFIQFISKVDKTGRCNGNQWQWENKRGYYLGSGKCFFLFFRCFNPSNWLDGVLAFLFRFVLFIILYPLLILVGKQTVPVVLK